jgi:hypothetical protein
VTYDELITYFGYSRRRDAVSHLLDGNTRPEVPPEPLESLLGFVAGEPRVRDVYVDVKLRPDQLEYAQAHAAVVNSPRFHHVSAELEVVRALHPGVIGDFELTGVLEVARELGLRKVAIGMGQRLWIDFYREVCDVIAARDRGELDTVIVWTVNHVDRMRDLARLGVDGIITDEAVALCRILAEPRPAS